MTPAQPLARFAIAPDYRQAEKVIETTTINTDGDHFRAAKNIVKSDASCLLLPEIGSGPSIGAQCETDFNVGMFGHKAAEVFLPGFFRLVVFAVKKLFVNGITQVGVNHCEVFQKKMLATGNHLRRMLKYHRKKVRIVNFSVANVAGILQLLLEYTCRRLVGLCSCVHHKTFRS